MKWKCWQSEKYTKTKKDGTGEQEAKHMVMKEKTGTVTTFLQDMCVELRAGVNSVFAIQFQFQFR